MSASLAIEITDLVKHYDGVPVVDGVSLTVGVGEIFGILGPNAAGKTTTVEMIPARFALSFLLGVVSTPKRQNRASAPFHRLVIGVEGTDRLVGTEHWTSRLFPDALSRRCLLSGGGMSAGLRTASDPTSAGAAVHAISDTWLGSAPPVSSLLVMAAFAVVFGLLATLFFRWE